MKSKGNNIYNFKRLILLGFMVLAVFFALPNQVKAGNMKISEKEIVMVKGASTTLSIKNRGHKKVSWKSNKSSVASVTKTGKVMAKSTGTAKIFASVGKTTFSCVVRVVNKNLTYSDFDIHWIENGVEAVHNPIQTNSGFSFWSVAYEQSTGNRAFSARKIKNGDSYNDVKRAYGKKPLKKFRLSEDKIYQYHIRGGSTVSYTTENETIPYDSSIEIPVFERKIKYYVEYAYKYNGYSNHYMRFYLDKKKKVVAFSSVAESYH